MGTMQSLHASGQMLACQHWRHKNGVRRTITVKRIIGCSVLVSGLCLATLAHADDVTLTGNEARPPKIFKDSSGVAQGVLIEVMRYVEKQTGTNANYQLYPLARALQVAAKGEAGFIGLSKSKDREAVFDFSQEPLFYDDLVLVVRSGKEFPFETVADLKGKKIGVARGGQYGEVFNQAVKDKVFEPIAGYTMGSQIAMVTLDRLDAVLVSMGPLGLEEALKGDYAKYRDKVVVLPRLFARVANHLAFAKGMKKADYLAEVDRAIAAGNKSGELPEIINNYVATRK